MSEEKPVVTTETERHMRRRTRLIALGIGIIVVVIVAAFIVMIAAGVTGEVRDIIIILLAVESLTIGGATLFLLYQIFMLVRLIREELIPLIHTAQDTVNSARGTTVYVSRKIVAPSMRATTTLVRLQTMARVLFRGK